MDDEDEFGIRVTYDVENELVKLYKDGKCIFTWDDAAKYNYPEDLCWSRDIGSLFWKAFKLGATFGTRKAQVSAKSNL